MTPSVRFDDVHFQVGEAASVRASSANSGRTVRALFQFGFTTRKRAILAVDRSTKRAASRSGGLLWTLTANTTIEPVWPYGPRGERRRRYARAVFEWFELSNR